MTITHVKIACSDRAKCVRDERKNALHEGLAWKPLRSSTDDA